MKRPVQSRLVSGFLTFAVLGVALATSSGCVVVKAPPAKGDISVGWALQDNLSCASAGVDSVVVSIRSQDSGELFEVAQPCSDAGGSYTDFLEGDYNVHLDGVDYDGRILFSAATSLYVDGGKNNDLGVLVLYDANPVMQTASLRLDWAFLYPSDSPTLDCQVAGADYINVYVTDDMGAVVFNQNIRCLDGPATIDDFNSGDYRVELQAYGDYHGQAVMLFDAAPIDVYLPPGDLVDVGTVDLDRDDNQFADLSVDWTFDGSRGCGSAGVDSVWFKIVRDDGSEVIDDEETVACSDGPVVRYTFVPDDYYVLVEGIDAANNTIWSGSVDFSMPPSSQVDVIVDTQYVD